MKTSLFKVALLLYAFSVTAQHNISCDHETMNTTNLFPICRPIIGEREANIVGMTYYDNATFGYVEEKAVSTGLIKEIIISKLDFYGRKTTGIQFEIERLSYNGKFLVERLIRSGKYKIKYYYNDQDLLAMEEVCKANNDKLLHTNTYLYNEQNRMIKKKIDNGWLHNSMNMNVNNDSTIVKVSYANGKPEETWVYTKSGNYEYHREMYSYNEDGLIDSIDICTRLNNMVTDASDNLSPINCSYHYAFQYDSLGRVNVETKQYPVPMPAVGYAPASEPQKRYHYVYNENGSLAEALEFSNVSYNENSKPWKKTVYNYNENDVYIGKIIYYDEKMSSYTRCTLDNNGLYRKIEIFDASDHTLKDAYQIDYIIK